ncbi:MAG: nuclear transport factor 2 family protein [Porticoccaceae bacterium]|jgi:3-phenylpropionate/cinnamic acid dioxygenase small subunit
MDTALEKRLQRVEDILAIQQLFIDYGHYLDAGLFDDYAALFAADGKVQLGPMGVAQGRDAIRELMTRALGDQVGKSFHIISSPRIAFEDDDRATSEVMWTVIDRTDKDRPVVTMIGRHRDILVREAGQWRFLRRRGYVDIPGALPGIG